MTEKKKTKKQKNLIATVSIEQTKKHLATRIRAFYI